LLFLSISIGCAAYGMRSWSEAIGHFESALKENPKCPSTVEQMAKAKARLAESLIGKYDLRKLLDDEQRGQRFMDVADFCGPVKIADIPGKGKKINYQKSTFQIIYFKLINFIFFQLTYNCFPNGDTK
jgi:hypothetical protein